MVMEPGGMGAVGVTGTGGTSREVDRDQVMGSVDVVGVVDDAFDVTVEFIGGAPDTAEVTDGDVPEMELLDEVLEVAVVAQDGGVCGASKGVLVLVVVSEEDGPSVTVTQSVMDTVLLLSSA